MFVFFLLVKLHPPSGEGKQINQVVLCSCRVFFPSLDLYIAFWCCRCGRFEQPKYFSFKSNNAHYCETCEKVRHSEDDFRCFRLSLSEIVKLPCSTGVAYDFRARKALQSGTGGGLGACFPRKCFNLGSWKCHFLRFPLVIFNKWNAVVSFFCFTHLYSVIIKG